jgi:hypothetical protein
MPPLLAQIAFLVTLLLTAFPLVAQTARHPEELSLLREVMPEALLAHASIEVASRDNIRVLTEGGLAFGILEDQRRVNNGMRAEVSVDYPFVAEDRVRYCWRFQLPPEFRSDAPENRWILVGQWHDQPETSLGETWETFQSHSPPIAIGLGEVDDEIVLALVYGRTAEQAPQQVAEPMVVERAMWNDICLSVHWSEGADGSAMFELNGVEQVTMQGANMNNAAPHYFKAGLYRHPEIVGDQWIALSEIEITHF